MPSILHRVGIKASPTKVYEAITTAKGLSHWWIEGTTGDAGKAGLIDFGPCKMKVRRAVPGKQVSWECTEGPASWVGTEVHFQLRRKEGQTFVLFRHDKWRREEEFMYHCSTKWATFLLSLKHWLESDEGRPYPHDVKILVNE